MGGGDVVVRRNLVTTNDTDNFAPPGNIVGGVLRGTGILVMANENVLVTQNLLEDNETAQVMVVAYTQEFTDERYNPYPRNVVVQDNVYEGGGDSPQLPGGDQLVAAFGGALPPVLWDGLQDGDTPVMLASEGTPAWSINLPRLGADPSEGLPSPYVAPVPEQEILDGPMGAPEELFKRIEG
jgi:hypothetical protein